MNILKRFFHKRKVTLTMRYRFGRIYSVHIKPDESFWSFGKYIDETKRMRKYFR
jgi:hypothetical protein